MPPKAPPSSSPWSPAVLLGCVLGAACTLQDGGLQPGVTGPGGSSPAGPGGSPGAGGAAGGPLPPPPSRPPSEVPDASPAGADAGVSYDAVILDVLPPRDGGPAARAESPVIPFPGGTYALVARHSGKCLEPRDGDRDDGAIVHQSGCQGRPEQVFRFELMPGNLPAPRFRLVNVSSKKCLEVDAVAAGDGRPLRQRACQASAAAAAAAGQAFLLDELGGGFVRLVAAASGKCVQVDGGSVGDGIGLSQWSCSGAAAQQWGFQRRFGGHYTFTARHSGKCLDVDRPVRVEGSRLYQWTCDPDYAQVFQVYDGGNGGHYLMNGDSNLCLGVAGDGPADGVGLVQVACGKSPAAQLFRVEFVAGGYERLVNLASGKCLAVQRAASTNGTPAVLLTCGPGEHQQWRLGSL